MAQSPEQQRKLSPEYWDGHDIFDENLFAPGAEVVEDIYLKRRTLEHAMAGLRYGLGQVAAGNATEVRYEGGEFNPELEPGSLVIIDDENIIRWIYDDPARRQGTLPPLKGPAPARPYSQLWLNNQDGTERPIFGLGVERVDIPDENAVYTRSLKWGVIAAQNNARFIQPFVFSTTKLLPDGNIYTPHALITGHHMAALPVPLSIGEVQVKPKTTFERPGYALTILERVRSIDIVYPAPSSKEPAKSKKGWAGSLFPRWGTSHI